LKRLASEADIPYRSIQNYLSGEQKPGAEALLKLRDSLKVNLDWLLTGEGGSSIAGEDDPLELINGDEWKALIKEIPKPSEVAFIPELLTAAQQIGAGVFMMRFRLGVWAEQAGTTAPDTSKLRFSELVKLYFQEAKKRKDGGSPDDFWDDRRIEALPRTRG